MVPSIKRFFVTEYDVKSARLFVICYPLSNIRRRASSRAYLSVAPSLADIANIRLERHMHFSLLCTTLNEYSLREAK
jgi:hypothetical protein